MNTDPIEVEQSLWARLKRDGVDKYRMSAAKILLAGVLVLFAGELFDREDVSTAGVWIFLAAFPMYALYRAVDFAIRLQRIDQENDEAARAAAATRIDRSE